MEPYLVVFGVAAVATALLTFPVRRFALRVHAVAHPDDRKIHLRPTPTIGGTAMYLAFIVAMLVASLLRQFQPMFHDSTELFGVILGATAIMIVGLLDDLRDMSAPAKVAGQVLAAMVLYFLGVTMFWFKVPFLAGPVALSSSLLPLVTALWVIGIANAVNLIDGLDGLAAGIVAIASAALCVYGVRLIGLNLLPADNIGPLVAAMACGVCVGFLPHNFYPARIFMGDGGAMFLGLLMASSTMVIGGRAADYSGETYFFFAPVFIPFFILGVPIIDVAFAIIRRTARRASISHADRDHLHHRLIRLGHGHRRAVLVLWAWTAVLSAFVLYPAFNKSGNAVVPFGAAFLGVVLYTLFRPGTRRRNDARLAVGTAEPALVGPVPVLEPTTGPIPSFVSGGAGVASAGEPDLASPVRPTRRDRSGHRRHRHTSRRGGTGGSDADPVPPARLAHPDDGARG